MKYKIEFSRFKREINFIQYAQSLGYEIDRKKSTRHSLAMRQGHTDKIVVSKKSGRWLYFSVYDEHDCGTIIDFIQHRTSKSLFEIGKELQLWLDGFIDFSPYDPFVNLSDETSFDPIRIKRLFNYCSPVCAHAYLRSRGITQDVLKSSRFAGRVFQDKYQNAVFPHFKNGQVCGLELKGENISLFVRGSEKTLWRSNVFKSDDCLVIAEAPVDALSYHIIHKLKSAFYIATCGGFSKSQGNYIKEIFNLHPQITNVIITTDNNWGGDKLTQRLQNEITKSDYNGSVMRHSPIERGTDWNDVLKSENAR